MRPVFKRRQTPSASANRLLAHLPDVESRRLLPMLRPVTFASQQVLYEADGPIEYAYFPTNAVLSALTVMQDGSAIEVATVGNEGVIGHYDFEGRISPHRVIVQLGDGALRIEASALQEEADRRGPMKELLGAYHVAFMAQVSQSVACNGLHRLEQRCSRWLLMCRDRLGSEELRLTHELLGTMLGATRERDGGPATVAGSGLAPISPGAHPHPRRGGAGGPRLRVLPGRPGPIRPAARRRAIRLGPMHRRPRPSGEPLPGPASVCSGLAMRARVVIIASEVRT